MRTKKTKVAPTYVFPTQARFDTAAIVQMIAMARTTAIWRCAGVMVVMVARGDGWRCTGLHTSG